MGLLLLILLILLLVVPHLSFPIAILVLIEFVSKKNKSILALKILNIIQFLFPFVIVMIAFLLFSEYKPALLLGLSLALSITFLLLVLLINIKQIDSVPLMLIKSFIQTIFYILLTIGMTGWFYYDPPRDHSFPTIISSLSNPIAFYIASGICVLLLFKHKVKFLISGLMALFGISLTCITNAIEKYSFVWLDPIFKNQVTVNLDMFVPIFIPLFMLILSILVYKQTKLNTSLWLIIGSSVLVIAFIISILYYNKYYVYESLVKNIISQSEFIMIGIFESLYLLAFAFMGLGLLGFKQMPMQIEATQ